MIHVESTRDFYQLILRALTAFDKGKKTWWERMRDLLVYRWRTKLVTLGLISFLWLILAGQQDFEVKWRVPIETKGLPPHMEIIGPVPTSVQITVRGLRKDASTLGKENVTAEVDLSGAHPGEMSFRIDRDQIRLPNDRVQLLEIDPS